MGSAQAAALQGILQRKVLFRILFYWDLFTYVDTSEYVFLCVFGNVFVRGGYPQILFSSMFN